MKVANDPYNRDFILVPAWLFEKRQAEPPCNKFLLSIFEDDTSDVDGCHSDAQGVAEAQHLIKRLGLDAKRERRTVMVTVEEVPEFKGKVNEEAIATLAPVIKKYQNRKKGIR